MADLVKVAEVYLVKDGEQFVGMELGWTESVLNEQGAASVLDTLRGQLDRSAWVATMVMRAGSDGRTEAVEGADEAGGEDATSDDAED